MRGVGVGPLRPNQENSSRFPVLRNFYLCTVTVKISISFRHLTTPWTAQDTVEYVVNTRRLDIRRAVV
jgi:hypothetical protein